MTDSTSSSGGSWVYGPCPACGAWGLEVPAGTAGDVVEQAIIDHDAQDHPGELAALAEAQRDLTQRFIDRIVSLRASGG